ncbi:hypothetical protein EC968_001877 [Mortierella alpina]|nr:hypothetical protein EC968_001877 [Mortierella alpina]
MRSLSIVLLGLVAAVAYANHKHSSYPYECPKATIRSLGRVVTVGYECRVEHQDCPRGTFGRFEPDCCEAEGQTGNWMCLPVEIYECKKNAEDCPKGTFRIEDPSYCREEHDSDDRFVCVPEEDDLRSHGRVTIEGYECKYDAQDCPKNTHAAHRPAYCARYHKGDRYVCVPIPGGLSTHGRDWRHAIQKQDQSYPKVFERIMKSFSLVLLGLLAAVANANHSDDYVCEFRPDACPEGTIGIFDPGYCFNHEHPGRFKCEPVDDDDLRSHSRDWRHAIKKQYRGHPKVFERIMKSFLIALLGLLAAVAYANHFEDYECKAYRDECPEGTVGILDPGYCSRYGRGDLFMCASVHDDLRSHSRDWRHAIKKQYQGHSKVFERIMKSFSIVLLGLISAVAYANRFEDYECKSRPDACPKGTVGIPDRAYCSRYGYGDPFVCLPDDDDLRSHSRDWRHAFKKQYQGHPKVFERMCRGEGYPCTYYGDCCSHECFEYRCA